MSDRLRIGVLCSAHGFGHLTRQLAIGAALAHRGATPVFYTAAPAALLVESLVAAEHVPWSLDVGLAQPDSLHVDFDQTLALLAERASVAAVDRLAADLACRGLDGVVADLPPTGLEAARRAGLPAVAVGNFDWAWIYGHFPRLAAHAARFRDWQAPHRALQLWPGPSLTGFRSVVPGPLVGRTAPAHAFDGPGRHVLVSFGGFGLADLDARLPRLDGVTWVLSAPMPALHRPDCLHVAGVPYPALVAGADAVLTKPGYGILAEALLSGTPLAWLARADWPETPFLAAPMEARGDQAITDGVEPALAQLWARPRAAPLPDSGAALAAAWILAQLFETGRVEGPDLAGTGIPDPIP